MTTRLSTAPATALSTALLILRLGAGVIMVAHGSQKLFQIGIAGVTEVWIRIGVPLPQITAPLVSVLEFAGGIALILGVVTRIVALLLAIDMLGALLIVHLPNGFFLPNGYEFVLILFCTCAALAVVGAGAYSVDAAITARRLRA